MNAMLQFENVCKSFGRLRVLENLNLTVERGERIAVIGASGCGKSLFLRLAELLEKPDSGRVFVHGEEISARGADVNLIRRRIGMVYQGFHLFEHLNVLDNITLAPRHLLKKSREDAEKQASELLNMVGLENRKYAYPRVLSGGQKQRIAIARALAMEPEIMLFDEPTSALDPAMVGEVLATIRMLAKKRMTMVIVTHEMNFAREVATRVLYFAGRGIREEGAPDDIFDRPRTPELQAFIRKLKFFSTHIAEKNFDLMRLHGGIREFAEKYGIGHKAAYRLQLCAEELVYEMIGGCFRPDGTGELELSVEYGEADRGVLLRCECAGKIFDPFALDGDEHLGAAILKNAAKFHSASYESGVNRIEARL